jgi:hypothetical protein
MHYADYRMAA